MDLKLETTAFPRWKVLLAAWSAFAASLFLTCLRVARPQRSPDEYRYGSPVSEMKDQAISGTDCVGYTFRFLKALFVEEDFSFEMERVLKSGKNSTTAGTSSYRAKVEIYYALFALTTLAMALSPPILALAPRRAAVLRKLRVPVWVSAFLVASFFPHALFMTHFVLRPGAWLWLASFLLLLYGTERARRDLQALEETPKVS